mmetsp:Transcript_18489/g.58510  ORF Transcript_18489/g.58510 Transcript_18489/m.58510 type:complete len:225 (-) Transcript_18489:226-900(-)
MGAANARSVPHVGASRQRPLVCLRPAVCLPHAHHPGLRPTDVPRRLGAGTRSRRAHHKRISRPRALLAHGGARRDAPWPTAAKSARVPGGGAHPGACTGGARRPAGRAGGRAPLGIGGLLAGGGRDQAGPGAQLHGAPPADDSLVGHHTAREGAGAVRGPAPGRVLLAGARALVECGGRRDAQGGWLHRGGGRCAGTELSCITKLESIGCGTGGVAFIAYAPQP